eukprot:gb/GEZN01003069.1/.p1 GENE.gb/GEZN01003069.1/~~gb/GEZN01003069.1/.p1  ORF type:complete len:691 (+),score=92.56 gb/GEZN01003069.1/:133-2205(+)
MANNPCPRGSELLEKLGKCVATVASVQGAIDPYISLVSGICSTLDWLYQKFKDDNKARGNIHNVVIKFPALVEFLRPLETSKVPALNGIIECFAATLTKLVLLLESHLDKGRLNQWFSSTEFNQQVEVLEREQERLIIFVTGIFTVNPQVIQWHHRAQKRVSPSLSFCDVVKRVSNKLPPKTSEAEVWQELTVTARRVDVDVRKMELQHNQEPSDIRKTLKPEMLRVWKKAVDAGNEKLLLAAKLAAPPFEHASSDIEEPDSPEGSLNEGWQDEEEDHYADPSAPEGSAPPVSPKKREKKLLPGPFREEPRDDLIFVGPTGVGKSYIITQLAHLDEGVKIDDDSTSSVTKEVSKYATKNHKGQIFDSPGLADTDGGSLVALEEIARVTTLHGGLGIIVVVSFQSTRFTTELQIAIKALRLILQLDNEGNHYSLIINRVKSTIECPKENKRCLELVAQVTATISQKPHLVIYWKEDSKEPEEGWRRLWQNLKPLVGDSIKELKNNYVEKKSLLEDLKQRVERYEQAKSDRLKWTQAVGRQTEKSWHAYKNIASAGKPLTKFAVTGPFQKGRQDMRDETKSKVVAAGRIATAFLAVPFVITGAALAQVPAAAALGVTLAGGAVTSTTAIFEASFNFAKELYRYVSEEDAQYLEKHSETTMRIYNLMAEVFNCYKDANDPPLPLFILSKNNNE